MDEVGGPATLQSVCMAKRLWRFLRKPVGGGENGAVHQWAAGASQEVVVRR